MNEKIEIENQLAKLAIDNDQEIANFVDLIDSSLKPYRVNVSKLGFDDGYSEGSSDTADAFNEEVSYRNGYMR